MFDKPLTELFPKLNSHDINLIRELMNQRVYKELNDILMRSGSLDGHYRHIKNRMAELTTQEMYTPNMEVKND